MSGWWVLIIVLYVALGAVLLAAPWIGARFAGDGRKRCRYCGGWLYGDPPGHRPQDMVACWTRREGG